MALLPRDPRAASRRVRHGAARRMTAVASSELNAVTDLGLDSLTFLAAVVVVVPLFKSLKVSPVLGFLLGGACVSLGHLYSPWRRLQLRRRASRRL